MSSGIFIKMSEPVILTDWLEFCAKRGIIYSPQTVGQNVFYYGDCEITFGKSNQTKLPKTPRGYLDFTQARPRDSADEIYVSTFWMGNLESVKTIARAICRRWKCRVSADPEFEWHR